MTEKPPATVPGDNDPSRAAAAATPTPDPETAEILRRHSAGEALTPREYGKMGAFKSFLNRTFGIGSDPKAPPAAAVPVHGVVAPADGSEPERIDPSVVQRTTKYVLESLNNFAVRYVGSEARKVGAAENEINRVQRAASLPPGPEKLMVELSPDVVGVLGINPKHYPVAAFVGAMGLWGANIWGAVNEIRSLQSTPAPGPKQPAPVTEAPKAVEGTQPVSDALKE